MTIKYILTAIGSYGNIVPFLRLGCELHSKGYNVVAITNASHCKHFDKLNIVSYPIDTEIEYENYLSRVDELNHPRTIANIYRDFYLPMVSEEINLIIRLSEKCQSVIIMNDAPGISARIAAEYLNLPIFSIVTYPNHFTAFSYLEMLLSSQLHSAITGIRQEFNLPEIGDYGLWWHKVNCFIATWPNWFSQAHAAMSITYHVGFILPENRSIALKNDSEVKNEILITGGSATFAGKHFFETAIRACLTARKHFKVIAKKQIWESFPIKEFGCHISEVDSLFNNIARSSLVIHHGGMGTIGQCIAQAIPQLILADGGDRPQNGKIVQDLKLGIALDKSDWLQDRISSAIDKLMDSREITKEHEFYASDVISNDPISRIIELLESHHVRAHSNQAPSSYEDNFDQLLMLDRLRTLTPTQRKILLSKYKLRLHNGLSKL
ncbi:glycosyltransferase family 1 protein [Dyadobacter arcticus]|uniref:UDP:flavonoid glycosyltransferase YjiC (YdhE family) n=1 Tax=Dyadobacter arcticus TaxID=1078754 RepID=A0ABX0UH31_9BACT|nr:glycosyltransferase family 1 protein [Dyadobacter arcticus]NIJ52323.1 UDP:flavonoid glycosyltransferase YjiC (YdhE family) [Dyadobacter arcticus]